MTRHTSIEAYNEIQRSGLLGERQRHAYNVLYEYGPLTGNELSQRMGIPGQWKRLSELQKRGLATEVGERLCKITGRNCLIWDVTANLPHKAEAFKRRTSRELELESEVQHLRGLVATLQHELRVVRDVLTKNVRQPEVEVPIDAINQMDLFVPLATVTRE